MIRLGPQANAPIRTAEVYDKSGYHALGVASTMGEVRRILLGAGEREGFVELGGALKSVAVFDGGASPARLDRGRSARPKTAILQRRTVSRSGRVGAPTPYFSLGGYAGRNGTNHTHPAGRTRCPKCGV